MKDRYRFRNPDLVAIRYETQCREVFDLHEAICDLIDDERANRVRVSVLTLATMIHDFPGGDQWEQSRVAVLEAMRDRGLIRFDGDVTLYGELEISLPERVYRRWHEQGKKAAANERPRDPKTGKLLPKNPAPTPVHPNGSPVDPQGNPDGARVVPSKTKTKAKTEKGNPNAGEAMPPSRRSVDGQIRETQRELQSAISSMVLTMVARANSARERMLTPHQELEQFWKPAVRLLDQHGDTNLRYALTEAAKANAISIGYAATVCGRQMQQRAQDVATNPDLAQSDWADFEGVTLTNTDVERAS